MALNNIITDIGDELLDEKKTIVYHISYLYQYTIWYRNNNGYFPNISNILLVVCVSPFKVNFLTCKFITTINDI